MRAIRRREAVVSPVENEVGGSTETPEKAPEKSESCTAAAIFEKFKKWAADANFEIGPTTSSLFGRKIRDIKKRKDTGVEKKRSSRNNVYTMDWPKLDKYLTRCGLFNDNV